MSCREEKTGFSSGLGGHSSDSGTSDSLSLEQELSASEDAMACSLAASVASLSLCARLSACAVRELRMDTGIFATGALSQGSGGSQPKVSTCQSNIFDGAIWT